MPLSDLLTATVKFVIAICGLAYGIYVLKSGIKREKKSFLWIGGIDALIKNPFFNIIYGIILIIIFSIGIIWYGAKL